MSHRHTISRVARLTCLLLPFAGCAKDDDQSSQDGDATLSASMSAGDGSSGEGTTDPVTTDPSASDTGAADSSSGGAVDETGSDFVIRPDGGGDNECDIWAQDCPDGEKCMPWANDGGSSWNATKCSPIDANPKQPGDPCTVEGSDVSGIDDCAIASMCFAVDPETNMGICIPFCTGTANDPLCENPENACNISNDGVLALCLQRCDPLLQDCPSEPWANGCYPVVDDFLCWPDYSFDLGAYGNPCEYFNVCDVGLFCAIPEAVPGCAGSSGCCSEFCDVTAMAACSGAADGQECIPWYMEGQAPPGYENVGFCGIML